MFLPQVIEKFCDGNEGVRREAKAVAEKLGITKEEYVVAIVKIGMLEESGDWKMLQFLKDVIYKVLWLGVAFEVIEKELKESGSSWALEILYENAIEDLLDKPASIRDGETRNSK